MNSIEIIWCQNKPPHQTGSSKLQPAYSWKPLQMCFPLCQSSWAYRFIGKEPRCEQFGLPTYGGDWGWAWPVVGLNLWDFIGRWSVGSRKLGGFDDIVWAVGEGCHGSCIWMGSGRNLYGSVGRMCQGRNANLLHHVIKSAVHQDSVISSLRNQLITTLILTVQFWQLPPKRPQS